jgi:hypothetical protein
MPGAAGRSAKLALAVVLGAVLVGSVAPTASARSSPQQVKLSAQQAKLSPAHGPLSAQPVTRRARLFTRRGSASHRRSDPRRGSASHRRSGAYRHAHPAGSSGPSLVGSWTIFGGVFRFVKTGRNTYRDQVIKQRPGVFCPRVNDQNGQIVLHRLHRHGRYYAGTWQWFYSDNCKPAGFGPVTFILWRAGTIGVFTADPPAGKDGAPITTTVNRVAPPAG